MTTIETLKEQYNTLKTEKGDGIPIFKPRAQDVLKQFIERAEQAECPAVGVDLDGCGSTIMAKHGQPVFVLERRNIEGRTASAIAYDLAQAYQSFCTNGLDAKGASETLPTPEAHPARSEEPPSDLPDTFRSIL